MHTRRRAGFTLTELLVVLGVVALLAAILIPVLVSARQRAHEAACVSNLHQINLALSMYVADNDGIYPAAATGQFESDRSDSGVSWLALIQPYVSKSGVLRCPDAQTPGGLEAHKQDTVTWGYAFNARLNEIVGNRKHDTFVGHIETTITYPALTVTVYDARTGIDAARGPDVGQTSSVLYGVYRADFIPDILAQTEGARRHHGGANYIFADGHTHWLTPTQVQKTKRGDGQHPGFGI